MTFPHLRSVAGIQGALPARHGLTGCPTKALGHDGNSYLLDFVPEDLRGLAGDAFLAFALTGCFVVLAFVFDLRAVFAGSAAADRALRAASLLLSVLSRS